MDDINRFDLVALVFGQIGFDQIGVCPTAPIALDEFGLNTKFFRKFFSQSRKVPGFKHQDAVPRRQDINQSGFPSARS